MIEIAEAHGHIAKLDFWMLETVISWIALHRQELHSTRFICVNFSGGSINDESFLTKVFDLLDRHRTEAALLCVEITESVAVKDIYNTKKFANRIREIGVRVAIDDFGAGYSSFGYLKDLPADALKVDGSLVLDAMDNPASQAILVALAGLATAMGLRSVGEFAENCETVKMLGLAGFDYAQGYAIGKPMDLTELIQAKSCADLIEDTATATYARLLQSGNALEMFGNQDRLYLH